MRWGTARSRQGKICCALSINITLYRYCNIYCPPRTASVAVLTVMELGWGCYSENSQGQSSLYKNINRNRIAHWPSPQQLLSPRSASVTVPVVNEMTVQSY